MNLSTNTLDKVDAHIKRSKRIGVDKDVIEALEIMLAIARSNTPAPIDKAFFNDPFVQLLQRRIQEQRDYIGYLVKDKSREKSQKVSLIAAALESKHNLEKELADQHGKFLNRKS